MSMEPSELFGPLVTGTFDLIAQGPKHLKPRPSLPLNSTLLLRLRPGF